VFWLRCVQTGYGRSFFERAYHAKLASSLRGRSQAHRRPLRAPAPLAWPQFCYEGSDVAGPQSFELAIPASKGEADAEESPLVIFLHGGAWVASDRADPSGVHRTFVADFAAKGWTCINANYRLGRGRAQDIAAACDDVVRLVDFVLREQVARAQDRGVVLMGHSSGAHLALQAAMILSAQGKSHHVRGVVSIGGVYDLVDFAKRASFAVRHWGPKGLFREEAEALKLLSPRHARSTALTCPVRLIHGGGEDFLLVQAQEFVLALQALKVQASLRVFERHDHFSLLAPSELRDDSIVQDICDFLSECATYRVRHIPRSAPRVVQTG
jgi:acetyl esterase/lipase